VQVLEGVVTVAQEGRFLMRTDDGVTHLLVLSHAAAAEPDQLPRLQHIQARVRVVCQAAPELIAHIARRIQIVPTEAPS
jgi:hypothetical protein